MRRRWVKVLVITVAVLAVLFTAADRVAAHVADDEVARLAKEKYGYANTTDAHVNVSIKGFPFLTQAAGRSFGHVTLTAGKFLLDSSRNEQGGYLNVSSLRLDLHDVKVASLASRSAEADLATGTLTLAYSDLSGAVTRLASAGGPLEVSQAPGSDGQAAIVRISGTMGGTAVDTTATLLAQGTEFSLTLPGAEHADASWNVGLPAGVTFTAARATADGVEITLVGHQVRVNPTRFGG